MSEISLHILGIRHHGPGSARMVARALDHINPDAILIEGPPDADEVLHFAAHADASPPVALLVYEPDQPRSAAYYPFAEFSPEWQALRWGLSRKLPVRFMDLPLANRAAPEEPKAASDDSGAPDSPNVAAATPADGSDPASEPEADSPPADPLDQLAHAAGFSDGEAWWGRLIEERHGDEHPLSVFDGIREAMAALREQGPRQHADPDEPQREAHMRRTIRAAIKEGHERTAVICGAWHAPVLTAEALKATPAKTDDAILKGLPKRKTTATWIPWTYSRLSMASGYGAGVLSPGWYEHLWRYGSGGRNAAGPGVSERWLSRVARLMREQDLDASPASVIESVRLADTLASLRGRSTAGLDEFTEATLSILCHGNPAPLRIIERKLIIGEKLGSVPEECPSVPLQKDLAAQQKSLRLKVSADDSELDLDQRKETDLERSRLLHRLNILNIPWGTRQAESRRTTSTFHEIWKLQWKPEFAVRIIEAARFGNTVQEAAERCVIEKAAASLDLPGLSAMLDSVLLANLPQAVYALIHRIQTVAAVASDLAHLMGAIPPLAAVLRYGNVRRTDAGLIGPVVDGLVARVCVGLLPGCSSLDDDAAARMQTLIAEVHSALETLEKADLRDAWRSRLNDLMDADIHRLICGRACRLLLDTHTIDADAVATRLHLALSRGNDAANAAAWLDGFLAGSGLILLHDPRLLQLIDAWVTDLSSEAFDETCPLVRRTFSTFEPPERRQIGEKVKHSTGMALSAATGPAVAADGHDPVRGSVVDDVLRLILGDVVR